MDSHAAPVEALNRLRTLFGEGRLQEVEAEAQSLVGRFPLSGTAWLVLGAALLSQGKPALAALKRAVKLMPSNAEALCNLGVALEHLGRFGEAESNYRQSIQLDPRSAHAHCSLANALLAQERIPEAIQAYCAALDLDPLHVKANHLLRSLYSTIGWLVDAEALCRKALALQPDFDEVRHCLAVSLAYLSRYDDVLSESDRALAGQPDHPVMWEQRLYCLSYHPDLSAEQIFSEFVKWGDRFPSPSTDFSRHDRNQDRRLRIGYISPDFRAHSSRYYFWPLLSNHDRTSFELYAYSNVQKVVAWTQVFREQFEHWRDIRDLDDEAVAELVRGDGIDILVDLCGHMEHERLRVFTKKPAPIQATWLGSAWTTGLKTIDYALFDRFTAPEGTLASETVLHLPGSYFAYQPPHVTAELRSPPALDNDFVTFGYTGRTERLNHRTFRVWGEILRRLPTARLILDYPPFSQPRTQAYYRDLLVRHGMDMERVTLRTSMKIFEGLNDIDILLDSFPHSGGTMLMDAFWMGVPAVTLASRPPVGRLGTSMLMNLGLPEWVATTEAEYIDKACGFAADLRGLKDLRLGMRERMRNSPLMDGPGFARGVEAAYRLMFDRWVAGTHSTGVQGIHSSGGVS